MNKTVSQYKIISTFIFISFISVLSFSCSKSNKNEPVEIDSQKITHAWYYFTTNNFEKIDLPQHAPMVLEKPWTEAIRISSAATLPTKSTSKYTAFAIVNRAGVLACAADHAKLLCDNSIFSEETADSLVFSDGSPVFNLYRSSFFNENIHFLNSAAKTNAFSATKPSAQQERPFLVQFNMQSNICYPLVSYTNLKLTNDDQITGFFWNGKTWACSVKQSDGDRVSFTYFGWEPLIPLTDLSPALTANQFSFTKLSEDAYRALNTPKLFEQAPAELKELLSTIPHDFSFYITWRDKTGTSPISYFQQGDGGASINANGALIEQSGYAAALFADGTTYIETLATKDVVAFRLPKLPAGYSYGEFAVAGDTLYVSWEESDFYKTGRSGFLTVDIAQILSKAK
jgi:hypothetical protein